VRARLREQAAIRRRFGYRRLLVLMRREGLVMNHKKFRRLYREERCKFVGVVVCDELSFRQQVADLAVVPRGKRAHKFLNGATLEADAASTDGEGSLAFSAGNRDHYTLGCASCKIVVMKRPISEVGSNRRIWKHI
jgi:hypothetical protein